MENLKYMYDSKGNFIDSTPYGSDEDIKLQFQNCSYILESFLGEKAIIENDTIRAYTRLDKINDGLESLQEGEYIKDNEISYIEKPSNFHIWDNKTNKWNYDKQLEIKSLNEELANLESTLSSKYDELDKAISRKLKTLEKRLNAEIGKLSVMIDEKYIKLEELDG